MKKFTLLNILIMFLLGGFTAKAQFMEGFNGTTTPVGWTVINLGDANTWLFGPPGDGTTHSGSGDAHISYDFQTAHDDYLITPQISVTADLTDQIRFYARNNGTFYVDKFDVLVSTTGVAATDFTDTLESQIGPPDTWTEYVYPLSDYVGQDIYIAFHATSVDELTLHIDDVINEKIPTCPRPADVTATIQSYTEADLSWTETGDATEWDVIYGLAGFDPATEGTIISDNNGVPGVSLTDLTPETAYEFYVRAICGIDDESNLSDMGEFFTGYCVYSGSGSGSTYYLNNFSTTGGTDNISNLNTGTSTGGYSNYTDQVVSKFATGIVNFDASFGGSGYTYGFNIYIDWNDDMVFDDSEKMYGSGAYVSSASGLISVPAGTPNGDYRMRVVANYLNTNPPACDVTTYGEAEDYTFSVIDPPSCLPPTDLVVESTSFNDAVVSWTENGSALQWEIIYGPTGFDPETEGITVIDDDGTPGTILADLTPETSYDFYVRAICTVDDESELSIPESFFTGYCVYIGTGTTYYINNFTTTGGTENISNLSTGIAPNGYANYTDQVVSQFATGIIDFTVSFASGTYGVNIYVDWDNNMSFDADEKMYGSGMYISPATGTINVPPGTPNGDYRMRVVADYLNTNPSPCGTSNYGEAEDYTFTVIDPPSCIPPTYLVVNTITSSTADVNWTENGDATAWEITYGISGFDPATEGLTVPDDDGTPGTTLSDLLPATVYDFYVRAICSADDESTLSGPTSFLTECVSVTEFSEDFDSTPTTEFPICWAKVGTGGYAYLQAYDANSEPNTLYMYAYLADEPAVVKTPPVSNLGDGTHQLSFWMRASYATGGVVEVGYLTDQYDASTFVSLGSVTASSLTYDPYIVIPPAGTYTDYLALRMTGVPANSLYIDDVVWEVIPTCPKPTYLIVESVGLNSADVNWTENGTATEWEIVYGESGFDPTTEGTTITDADGTPGTTIPGLTDDTNYDFYVRAVCGADDISTLAGPKSFATLCLPTDVTYTMDFESATVPDLPNCTAMENLGTGNDWVIENLNNYGFNSKVLSYSYDFSNPANAWFYTQGINMTAGTDYQISYQYGNNSTFYAEKMKVSYGTAVGGSAMVNELADYPNISMAASTSDTIYFSVDADGVYYFGFNVYSDENEYYLYVDNIEIKVAAGCEAPSDVTVTNIDANSATVSWTETTTATEGYTVEVFTDGANPDTDTPVYTETVAAGITTADVTGLDSLTTYDAYVTSNCGAQAIRSDVITFTTSATGIGELEAYGFTYYPNPVKNIVNMSADTPIQDITVYNLLGKKVIRINPESTTVSMDMSNLASGSYLVKVTINGSVSTYKLMKN